MPKNIGAIKVTSRGPVISQKGTGLNSFGQPVTPGPTAPTPNPPRRFIGGQPYQAPGKGLSR